MCVFKLLCVCVFSGGQLLPLVVKWVSSMGACYSTPGRGNPKHIDNAPYSPIPGTDYPTDCRRAPLAQQEEDLGMPAEPVKKRGGAVQASTSLLQKPYGGRYGYQSYQQPQNQQAADDNTVTEATVTASTVTSPTTQSSAQSYAQNKKNNMNRFGFNKPSNKQQQYNRSSSTNSNDSNSNTTNGGGNNPTHQRKNSLDSMNSLTKPKPAPKVPASTETVRRNKRGFSFNPKDGDKWRMIDEDSSTSNLSRKGSYRSSSRQSLASARSVLSNAGTVKEEGVSEDIINANVAKPTNASAPNINLDGRIHIPDKKNSSNGGGSSSRLPSFPRFRGPFQRSNAVQQSDKAAKTAATNNNATKTPKSDRTRNNSSGKNDTNDNKSSSSSSRFLRKGFFSSKQKSLPEKSSQKLPTSASAETTANQTQPTPSEVRKSKTTQELSSPQADAATDTKPSAPKTSLPNLGNPLLQQKLVEKSLDLPDGAAPIAMTESLEVTSLGGSIDDLMMLDTEVQLDDYDDIPPPPPTQKYEGKSFLPSRPRSRSRSHSRDSLDAASAGHTSNGIDACSSTSSLPRPHDNNKAQLLRRHTEGSMKKRHPSSSKSVDTEPIQELADLMTHQTAHQGLVTCTVPIMICLVINHCEISIGTQYNNEQKIYSKLQLIQCSTFFLFFCTR